MRILRAGTIVAINLLTAEAQHVDPVCGMTVGKDSTAGSFAYRGTTYYFCSEHCRKKFAADPERHPPGARDPHVGGAPPASASGYTCPMHPEVVSDKPGPCPKCG